MKYRDSLKKFGQIVLVCALVASLSACGSDEEKDPYLSLQKEELVTLTRGYESQIASLNEEITEKDTLLQGIQTSTEPTTAIQTIPDGTGRLTFNEYSDGTIALPVPLEYPEAEVANTQNKINLSDAFSIQPDQSWNCVLKGSKMELENNDLGIGAVVQIGYRSGNYISPEFIQTYMQDNFFPDWPPENITYQVLMIDSIKAGMDAYTHTFIDGEDAWVRIGLGSYGNTTFAYSVCYKGAESSVANAAIKSLLQSIRIATQNLQIEG